MTDSIRLKGMRFFGYHGVMAEETRLGQQFTVDVELQMDLRPAGLSDDLNQTLDYSQVFNQVKEIMEGPPCKLLETLAERISATLLERFPTDAVRVEVFKPGASIQGIFDKVSVDVYRRRSQ